MRRGAVSKKFAIAAAVAAATGLSACGGGTRQDAHAPSGNFPVQIPTATFPVNQRLAQRSTLTIKVRNAGTRTIPNVAVTICNGTCGYPAPVGQGTSVQPFAHYLKMPGLAYHSRPVWIVDQPPGTCGYSCAAGGRGTDFTVDANTWASGPLKPGDTATFRWAVTAVTPGRFTVAWKVAAGIYGNAKAVLSSGSTVPGIVPCQNQIGQPGVCGSFTVNIAHPPAQSHVNDNGQVVPGA